MIKADMSQIYGNVVKCFAYLSILIGLSKGKKLTGFDIVVHVTNLGLEVSPGTVYHQLGMLSRDGIIRGERQKNKTVYEITEKGMKVFKEFKKQWKKPLEYAYHNLHT